MYFHYVTNSQKSLVSLEFASRDLKPCSCHPQPAPFVKLASAGAGASQRTCLSAIPLGIARELRSSCCCCSEKLGVCPRGVQLLSSR